MNLRLASFALAIVAPLAAGVSFFGCTKGSNNEGYTTTVRRCAFQPGDVRSPPASPSALNKSFSVAPMPVRGCDAVASAARNAAIAKMDAEIDAQIEAVRGGKCSCFNETVYVPGSGGGGGGPGYGNQDASAAPSASGNGNSGGSSGAKESSSTNNQVAGVDEADFIKNDGKYIYVASDSGLKIIDAYPGASAHTVGTSTIEGAPRSLFLAGDRIAVYSSVGGTGGAIQQSDCTYGYNCVPTGDGRPTKLTIFDVSDRAAPKVVREVRFSGSFIAGRKIENAIHTVVTQQAFNGDDGWYGSSVNGAISCDEGSDLETQRAQAIKSLESSKAAYAVSLARTEKMTIPSVVDSANGGEDGMIGCPNFYRSEAGASSAVTSVVSLDLFSNARPTSATIVSDPGHVYASDSALYVGVPFARNRTSQWFDGNSDASVTALHKFAISSNAQTTAYRASGLAKGAILNQFSMDEKDGYLRVAASLGRVPDPNVTTSVTVLAQVGPQLLRTGSVDGLAPHEDIRSVRFEGNRGFVVTFKKTDPLYVIGLDQPAAPVVLGELKIPGFSTYMHMMDANHLLTIGYDADDNGSFAYFNSVILQIFDVTNPKAPTLLHKHSIGTRGSTSEALANHLAFNYFAPKNLLAIPMTICEGGGNGSYGTNMTFNGLMVFDTTLQNGFSERGRISHPNGPGASTYNNRYCSNWWTDASSVVKRSVIMDDTVYSVAKDVIRIANLNSLSTPLAEVNIK